MHSYLILLAAVGWYLMLPPVSPKDKKPDLGWALGQPISEWVQNSSFDTAKDCESTKDQTVELEKKKQNKILEDIYLMARCIASDDPRLKP